MSKLKKEIYDLTKDEYQDLPREEFELLNQILFRHLLSSDYYKNQYEYSYIIQNQKNDAILYHYDEKTTSHSLYDSIVDEKYYNEEGHYLFNLKNIQNIYMSKDHKDFLFEIINDLLTSSNFHHFIPKIEKRINKEPNFQRKLISLQENLFNLETAAIIEKTIKFCRLKKEKDPIINDLIYETSSFFDDKKEFIFSHLNKLKTLIQSDTDFLNSHSDKVDFVLNKIKETKPYLFNKTDLNDVSFHFFELEPEDNGKPRVIIDENKISLLNDINIVDMSKKIVENNEKEKLKNPHFDEGRLLFNNIYKQNDEISTNLSYSQMGFSFIDRNTFASENKRRSFLLAVKNNEVIGSIIYENLEENLDSPLKRFYSSNVKKNYRELGLSKMLYDQLSKIMLKEKYILVNTMYTQDGEDRLKKHKQELNKSSEVFFLDTDINYDLEIKNEKISDFNREFLKTINKELNSQEIKDNLIKIKNIYNKNIDFIIKSESLIESDYDLNLKKSLENLLHLKVKIKKPTLNNI